jgi:type IV pilus assembly protein PilY1
LGNTRCDSSDPENCSLIGDVMHSTPIIVDRPSAAVEDETYDLFATANRGRMMMTYMSSNDGILHGFALSPNKSADPSVKNSSSSNEMFAFIPPAVLPLLKEQYANTRLQLLDGVPVSLDVVATADATVTGYGYRLERSNAAAQGASNLWRTVLVQGFGGDQPGYFAMDITDPENPTFLWQLTTTVNGNKLFGPGGQPIITTVNVNNAEVAVAVLPGGQGDSPTGASGCTRKNPSIPSTYDDTHYDPVLTAGFPPRSGVACYSDTPALK